MDGSGSLPTLDADGVIRLAEALTIQDKSTTQRVRWRLTGEQDKAIRETLAHKWTIHAKPRQIGMSTVHCLLDVLWAWNADAEGVDAACAIVLDTEAKAVGRLKQCEDFAKQLGIPHKRFAAGGSGPARIELAGGAVICAFGSSGTRVGSSYSFHRFHFSEIPYWHAATDLYNSLKPALSDDGVIVIETTMDVGGDPLARNLWVNQNDFHKVFYSVEDHGRFRRDPSELTEEQWEYLRDEEGFTKRAAAAWWSWALENEAAGDLSKLCHSYPQRPEHLFMGHEGRFVRRDPQVLAPVREERVTGFADTWTLEVYREVEEHGQYVIGVDTAAGRERDQSAVVVIDKKDEQICAVFANDEIWTDDLITVSARAQEMYTTWEPPLVIGEPPTIRRRPVVVIEENGVGAPTWQGATRLGLPAEGIHTTEATKLDGLLTAKRAIEAGRIYGPRMLYDEVAGTDEIPPLHRDNYGRFRGRKDIMMALGFALRHLRNYPYQEPPEPEDRTRFRLQKRWKPRRRRKRL